VCFLACSFDTAELERYHTFFAALSHTFTQCNLGTHCPLPVPAAANPLIAPTALIARWLQAGIVLPDQQLLSASLPNQNWTGDRPDNVVTPSEYQSQLLANISPPSLKGGPLIASADGNGGGDQRTTFTTAFESALLRTIVRHLSASLDPYSHDVLVLYRVFDDTTPSDPIAIAPSDQVSPSSKAAAVGRRSSSALSLDFLPRSDSVDLSPVARPYSRAQNAIFASAIGTAAPAPTMSTTSTTSAAAFLRSFSEWAHQLTTPLSKSTFTLRSAGPPTLSVVLHLVPKSLVHRLSMGGEAPLSHAANSSIIHGRDQLQRLQETALAVYAKAIRRPYNIEKLGDLVRGDIATCFQSCVVCCRVRSALCLFCNSHGNLFSDIVRCLQGITNMSNFYEPPFALAREPLLPAPLQAVDSTSSSSASSAGAENPRTPQANTADMDVDQDPLLSPPPPPLTLRSVVSSVSRGKSTEHPQDVDPRHIFGVCIGILAYGYVGCPCNNLCRLSMVWMHGSSVTTSVICVLCYRALHGRQR
jgi:hypothetical protein